MLRSPNKRFNTFSQRTIMAVFSRRRMSRLTFQKVFCLQTKLSDLKLIGVFTSKIITFHFGNLRRARANKSISIIWRETEKMVACTSYFFSLLCLCGWLSSDGGADFNKGCDCSQLEAGWEEQMRALFSYGENFVKGKSLGFLRGHSSGSSIWF